MRCDTLGLSPVAAWSKPNESAPREPHRYSPPRLDRSDRLAHIPQLDSTFKPFLPEPQTTEYHTNLSAGGAVTQPGLPEWTSDAWEDYVNRLLSMHHGASNYQRIPATHGGDHGIEGYSLSGC